MKWRKSGGKERSKGNQNEVAKWLKRGPKGGIKSRINGGKERPKGGIKR
jgi:hypothetical protein